jgi:hypothetical protein
MAFAASRPGPLVDPGIQTLVCCTRRAWFGRKQATKRPLLFGLLSCAVSMCVRPRPTLFFLFHASMTTAQWTLLMQHLRPGDASYACQGRVETAWAAVLDLLSSIEGTEVET